MSDTDEIEIKDFIQVPIKRVDYHDSAVSFCFCLTEYAKEYIHSEQSSLLDIKPKLRNAVLIDAINYIGIKNEIDFGLNTEYLFSEEVDEDNIEPELLLNVVLKEFTGYLSNENIEESVVEHRAYTDYKFGFDNEEAEAILFDFIRFIAWKNYYDIENELTKMKNNINRRRYLNQGKVGFYQKRLKTEPLEKIFEQELEAMIIAFLYNEENPDMIEDGFLKAKVLSYINKQQK